MRWRFPRFCSSRDILEAGELARRLHERWLNKAMEERKNYPRIPVRPAVTGGFTPMMDKRGGPRLAERWWDAAFERMDRIDGPDRVSH
jgi:hypothetical protein